MIVALKPGVTQESREQLMDWLQNLGLHIHVSEAVPDHSGTGGHFTKGGYGPGSQSRHCGFRKAGHWSRSSLYATANFTEDTVVEVGDVKIGERETSASWRVPAPWNLRSRSWRWPRRSKASGANMLRGGAFKPRTSPYDFAGLKAEGSGTAEDRPAGDRSAHCHRDHERGGPAPL